MPIYTVQGPDGKTYDIEGPANATAEQLGQVILQQQRQPAMQAPQAEGPTFTQKLQSSMPMRLVQGARDPIDAGAQLLPSALERMTSGFGYFPNSVSEFFGKEADRVNQGVAENERNYEEARKATGQEGIDFARIAGNVVSPANYGLAKVLPTGATTAAGRAIQGAALGATGGALTPVNTDKTDSFWGAKGGQMMLGGIAGGVLTPLAGGIADWVGSRLAGMKAPKVEDLQRAAQELADDLKLNWQQMTNSQRQELVDQVGAAVKAQANATPAVSARIQDFKREQMPYTLGQITRDPGQFAREKNLSQLPGTGDPLRERLMQQGRQLQDKLGSYANGAVDEQTAGALLAKALRAYDEKLSGNVRELYTAARNSAGKDAELPLQGLSQDVAETLDNFGDKVPSGVLNQFKKFGILPGQEESAQRKLFTVEEADKLLKVINANQSSDPATNTALGQLRAAVKRAVTTDGGAEDVFAGARKAAAERFGLHDAVPALEAASNGSVNPDTFVNNFVLSKGAQTKQVQDMAKILRDSNSDAFNQARAQIGSFLQRKAFGENVAGDKAFSPERYATALRQLGPEKLKAFFSPEELAQMERVGRIASYIDSVPNASKPNTSGNWGAITSIAEKIPGIPSSVALARALRSGVANNLDVSSALAAKPPSKLTPEEIRFISQLLSQGAVASGAASAGALR